MEPEKYNCLVVDDEPIARKIIVNYIEQMPLLTVAAECINALSTIDYLRTHPDIDIIFPTLSGYTAAAANDVIPPIKSEL